jgi:ribonuclease HI
VDLPNVDMFTDGACRGNPGPGGWAVLLRTESKERELSGGEALTTNNRMELMAAIKGLVQYAGATNAAAPKTIKHHPITGTTFTETAPPHTTADP